MKKGSYFTCKSQVCARCIERGKKSVCKTNADYCSAAIYLAVYIAYFKKSQVFLGRRLNAHLLICLIADGAIPR